MYVEKIVESNWFIYFLNSFFEDTRACKCKYYYDKMKDMKKKQRNEKQKYIVCAETPTRNHLLQ